MKWRTAIGGWLAMAMIAFGQSGWVDPETGRDLRHWPPARHFDHLHMTLELDIPDMSDRRLSGRETLTVTPIGRERRELGLDAKGLEIRQVHARGRQTGFKHDGESLLIELSPAARLGETVEIVIEYSGEFQIPTGAGLTWTLGDPTATSETGRMPQIHSQGQPEDNSRWFPCHDFPNEQLSTELIVDVDKAFQVVSNGTLVGRDRLEDGRARWHWKQQKPHSAYLVALVVGRFAVVGLGGPEWDRDPPLTVYAPVGMGETAADLFEKTPAMLIFFEELFDEPYPWEKYSQAIVREFAAGAMENTSISTFNDFLGAAGNLDDTIAHELAHQWIGNLVPYESWEHLWLGEGWATYAQSLWREHEAGPERAREAYHQAIFENLAQQRGLNRTQAPDDPAMASNWYTNPTEAFLKPNNPYSRGALVLHMLRGRLGDETFFRATRLLVDRYRHKPVETSDFRKLLEEVSGQDLERFFGQWVHRPGLPRLRVDLAYDEADGELRVRVEQIQPIDADNPAYAVVLPLYVAYEDGTGEYVYVPTETRVAEASFALAERPADVVADPNLRVLADTLVRKPLAWWEHQAEHGPTELARLLAREELGERVRVVSGGG